jgi:hypothetical protein
MKSLLLAVALLVATPVVAQEPVASVPSVTVNGDKVTVNDMVVDAAEVVKAVNNYRTSDNSMAKRLGLLVLLSAVFKMLLSCLKFTGDFWKGSRGRLVMRLTTLLLGALVFFVDQMVGGENVFNSLMLAVSGPLAISMHELSDIVVQLLKKKKANA